MMKISRPIVILVVVAAVLGLIVISGRRRKSVPAPKAVTGTEIKAQATVMRLLPPDVKTALWLDLERLHAGRVAASLLDAFWGGKLAKGVEQFAQATTVNLRIELNELLIAGDATDPESLLIIGRGSFETTIILAVLRQSERIEAEDYLGASIFRMPEPKNHFECLCVFGPNEIAGGTENAVKEMLDYRESSKGGTEPAGTIQQALMLLNSNAVARAATLQFASLPKVKQNPFEKSVRLATISASIVDDSEAFLQVRMELDDAKLAQQGYEFLETALKKARAGTQRRGLKFKVFRRFADSITIKQKDNTLSASAYVSSALIEKLIQSRKGTVDGGKVKK
ncbi:MAG: hypothetical protein PHI84_17400 [Kiritimatiellae bacterium]|nr:hypothetical protein [Kiritimatiellia bacterium]